MSGRPGQLLRTMVVVVVVAVAVAATAGFTTTTASVSSSSCEVCVVTTAEDTSSPADGFPGTLRACIDMVNNVGRVGGTAPTRTLCSTIEFAVSTGTATVPSSNGTVPVITVELQSPLPGTCV